AATYSYDTIGQLTGATRNGVASESYTYDASGNRLSSHLRGASQLDLAGRTIRDSENTYDYDAEGNLIRQTSIASGDYISLDWDHRNRLTTVRQFAAGGGAPLVEIEYAYDPLNRRVRERRNTDTVYSTYDGQHRWSQTDSGGGPVQRFFNGLGVDEV